MTYFSELCSAMSLLAEQPNSIFLGQAVSCDGTAMRNTLKHLPEDKLLELPVAEDMQMGMTIGLSLSGYLPICIYPRINFLLLATNQLVLHLDKLPLYGNGFEPKVIIRTAVASRDPLDPGPQHLYSYFPAIELMLKTIVVEAIVAPEEIVPIYKRALNHKGSTIIVEYMSEYNK